MSQAVLRTPRPQGVHYGYVVLLTGILTVTGALGLARFGYTMILPAMKQGLALNNSQMGFLATGNFVGYMLFSLVGGFLASKYGPRTIIACSMLLAGLTMGLTGLAGGVGMALAMRTLTGLGSGGSNVPVMGLASAWFAPRRRGMATGLMVGGSGIALVLTGYLVPAINASGPDGWRTSWLVLGGTVVLLGLLALAFLRNSPREKGLLPVGAEGAEAPAGVPAEPPQWSQVYRSRALWQLGLIYTFFGFSYIIYATFFAAYLVQEKGLTQAAAGNLWAWLGAISMVSGLVWGSLSDQIGRKYGMAIVFALQAVCFFVFAGASSYGGYLLSALLFGLTAWSIPGIVAAACGDLVGARLAPAALGMVTLFFSAGQALGPSIAGILADASSSFGPAFTLAGVMAVLGVAGSLVLPVPRQRL